MHRFGDLSDWGRLSENGTGDLAIGRPESRMTEERFLRHSLNTCSLLGGVELTCHVSDPFSSSVLKLLLKIVSFFLVEKKR